MHDDIGSTLSSLNIFSDLLKESANLSLVQRQMAIQKIGSISSDLMEHIHDIIWSLDTDRHKTSLEDIVKSHVMQMLTIKDIQAKVAVEANIDAILTNPKARKNILMILKEIINNCSKYSQSKTFTLSIGKNKQYLEMIAKDDGIGFDPKTAKSGNGLSNIKKRTKELLGVINLTTKKGTGVVYHICVPLKVLTHSNFKW